MRLFFRFVVYLAVVTGFSASHAGAYEDFFKALEFDDERVVANLLQRGFDPNSRSPKGQPALLAAIGAGSSKVTEQLMRQPGLQLDQRNDHQETALMMAALRGQKAWAQRLLELGAQVNHDGWTPLHYAAAGPDSAPVVELLLAHGAQVDAKSPNGTTPLMMAARYGSEASVQILLAAGADRRVKNQRDFDAADFARMAGRDSLATRIESVAR